MVTALRIVAIGFIYCCTAVAWVVLGSTVVQRTGEFDGKLGQEVAQLWGGQHNQVAPAAALRRPRTVREFVEEKSADGKVLTKRPVTHIEVDAIDIPLDSSRIKIEL